MSFEAAVHAQAIELDGLALNMCAQAGSGHPTTAMSLGHITTVLFFNAMRYAPELPDYPTSDRLVLSAGHAVPIIYAACAKAGVYFGKDPENRRPLTVDDLSNLRELHSELDGHPNPREGFPFFDAATGSLGMGLSVAAGLAEAARLDNTDRRIYCIIGDGEAREGQIAEALDYIAERNLNNVLPIFNCNQFGQAGKVSQQQSPEVLLKKLDAYGFNAIEIDGHAPQQTKDAFDNFAANAGSKDKPIAIVAKTVKGWGAPSLQGGGWHGKPASGDALSRALAELDERRAELTSALSSADAFTIQVPNQAEAIPAGIQSDIPSFDDAMKARDMKSVLDAGKFATRKAYGLALQQLGKVTPNLVVLDADVSNSTFAIDFAQDPDLAERFFECKIAEQHMISQASGLSAAGKIPFASTFAKFATRAYDQIEMAMNSGANLKIVGSHAGVSLAADGPSQMSLPDVAWFRSLASTKDHRGNPGCYILQPADAYAAYALTNVMADYEGMCYMRTHRPDVEFLYSADDVFNLGGFQILQEGRDILIAASGYMVHEANKLMELLDNEGVSAGLVDLYSLPFDQDKLLDLIAQCGGRVLTLEDNYGGGIGSAIAEAVAISGDGFEVHAVNPTRIPKSAKTPAQELEYLSIDANAALAKAMEVLEVVGI